MEVEKNYISTSDTMNVLNVDQSGIAKLRKIYRQKGKLRARELFTQEQIPELLAVVQYQRQNPHSSYAVAYEAVTAKAVVEKILAIADDDLTGKAEEIMGADLERFFDLSNELTDLIRPYSAAMAHFMIQLEGAILQVIIEQAEKRQS